MKLILEEIRKCFGLIILVIITYSMYICLTRINFYKDINRQDALKSDYIRDNCLREDIFKKLLSRETKEIKKYNNILNAMYYNNGIDKFIVKEIIRSSNYYKEIVDIVRKTSECSKYYPVVYSKDDILIKDIFYFENSWKAPRNYGGDRIHEGTDIMYKLNKADVVPIVSICNGTIDKKGWLRLGGYRLYIKSNDSVYMYYAHLSSYAKGIDVGDKVYAGQIIGYMGNTGYGKEGTKDKFDVHLHLGIYYKNKDNMEVSINPYYLLKRLKNNKLVYDL